ncbi:MAG: lipoate--protein ligase family protein [Candidatus Lokiarchaeota archaeon]|nr:lipoate--protein ligase family protein [Candidatus Lokiarchaeota archaeon]
MIKKTNDSSTWRLIFPEYNDPFLNLALEDVLFQEISKNGFNCILRFWKVHPCCIIGRHQYLHQEINEDYCKKKRIPIIRRISGGGAVYLDLGCLNFSLIFNEWEIHSFSAEDSYSLILRPIIKALKALSFEVRFVSPNSLFYEGKKVSGSSQFRKGNVILHHGTLLLDSNLNELNKSLASKSKIHYEKSIKSVKVNTTNLFNDFYGNFKDDHLIKSIISTFENDYNFKFEEKPLQINEIEKANELVTKKYSSLNWTYHSRIFNIPR